MEATTLIGVAVVMGVGLVTPLALRRPLRSWLIASGALAISLLVPSGVLAAALVGPWVVLAAAESIVRARRVIGALTMDGVAGLLVPVYSLVAASAFVQARSGVVLVGPGDPIATLTAVHFTYAGTAALALAVAAHQQALGAWRTVATAAIALTATAPMVVAAGFLTRGAGPQVGGAMMMTAGVWSTAAAQLAESWRRRSPRPVAILLALSSCLVIAPMVLAVAWALGQHADTPALSIPDMVRTHGSANAVGFVLLGLVARFVVPVPNPQNWSETGCGATTYGPISGRAAAIRSLCADRRRTMKGRDSR